MEWRKVQLGEVAKSMLGGGTPSTKNPEFWQGNIPWITSKSLGQSIYLTTGEKTVSEEAVRKSATHIVPANNLIFATRVGVGKVVVTKIDVAISQDSTGIVVDSNEIDPTFLALQLRSDEIQRFVTQNKRGATIQGITRTSLQQIEISLPPLPEQRRIAHILSTVQRAIEQQAQLIALTRELKSALMHKLFSEGLHGEKQKETEIGLVPESWEVVTLKDVCELIVDCPHTTPKFQSTGVRIVRNFNIRNGRFVNENTYFTSEEDYLNRTKRAEPRSGDILFSREAPVGEACLVPSNLRLSLGQRTMLLRSDFTKLDAEFMVYNFYSSNVRTRMLAIASGLTVAHLNVADVRNLLVPVPSLHEQIKIGQNIATVDERIELAKNKQKLLEELFRTLLHQLMTGQIRVDGLEVDGCWTHKVL